MIAVKRFASTITGLQDAQYENEAQHLMRLKHPNIVQLVGYCSETEMKLVRHNGKFVRAEQSERLLCLEYLQKGSLREHLSDESSGLDWNMRYKIIEGICYGLHYLHEEWQATPIIHMDLKPANILLDDNMVPKIADFGLSRLFGEEQARTCTRSCKGTLGYMAPEYLEKGVITKKCDIFSLGVTILEIITGLKDYPTDETETTSQQYIDCVLNNWRHRLRKVQWCQDIDCQQIEKCIQIGLLCVQFDRSKRPTINQIIKLLEISDEAYQNERVIYSRPCEDLWLFPRVPSSWDSQIVHLQSILVENARLVNQIEVNILTSQARNNIDLFRHTRSNINVLLQSTSVIPAILGKMPPLPVSVNERLASYLLSIDPMVLTPNVPDIVVAPPDDGRLRHVIDTMALHVLDGGCAFEQAVMERGRGNPIFDFLFDLKSKEHTYYVWRLYSFAQGDTLQRWRTEPYIMITGSGRWVPPPLSSNRSPEREKESTFAAGRSRRVEVERTLTDSQRDEFEDMLRALTLERSQIKDAMGFALDNADAAGEIVEVLTESLTLKETSIPTKVARLMLVSDILHNSSAPVKNASAFRTKFEASLPDVMESFNDLYRSITGRMTAEALKERVMKVLQVWADWFLFSDAFLNGLRATFLRSGNSGVVPFHSLCGDAPEIEKKGSSEDGNDGFKLNEDGALATGKAAATKELLGLPLAELERRCRHNGLSLCGGKEMMVARLLNLEEAEKERVYEKDVDMKYVQGEQHTSGSGVNAHSTSKFGGSPNGDELDISRNNMRGGKGRSGESASAELESFPSKKPKYDPVLPASKWSREDDISDDEDRKGGRGLGLSYSSGSDIADDIGKVDTTEASTDTTSHHHDTIVDEEHRQKLRQIEISVMQYRESLEEQGLRNLDEIERKVASHRRRLQSEYGLSTSTDGANNRRSSERTSSERKERHDDAHEYPRKRRRSQSRSRSPPRKSQERDREHNRSRDRSHGNDAGRDRVREKSASRGRDDHYDRSRDREKDRRKGR